MKPANNPLIHWYSLVSGIAASALLYAHLGLPAAAIGMLLVFPLSDRILLRVRGTDESSSPYSGYSEQTAAVGLILFLPLIFLSDLLTALLVFLGFGYLSLLLQTHDNRRLYLGLGVGFTALMAGAVVARTGYYLVFLTAYAVAISITLGHIHLEPMGQPRHPWRVRDQLRSAAWLISIALLIYLLLPRFPAGNLGSRPGSDHYYQNSAWEQEARQTPVFKDPEARTRTLLESLAEASSDPLQQESEALAESRQQGFRYQGFNETLDMQNPDASGDRFSNTILARMRADVPLYLRARSFDIFDGVRWHSSAKTLAKMELKQGEIDLLNLPPGLEPFIEQYEIILDQDLVSNIVAAAVPVRLRFPGTVIGIDAFHQLQAPGVLRKGTAYSVESLRLQHHGRDIAERSYSDLPGYTQLPDDLDPRIATLAREITEGIDTPFEQALALESHLRNHYDYDFESVFLSQHQTPLSRFLFETRRGHCEYFASALAILLRTLDIPSRLVSGFSATDLNPLTGYYEIHALDGHAWVEAYIENIGWLELEPTAYYEMPTQLRQTLSAEQINQYVERQLRLDQTVDSNTLSLDSMIGSVWQILYLSTLWILAHLKLILADLWPWLTGLAMTAVLIRLSWPWLAPRWRARRIRDEVYRKAAQSHEFTINDWFEGIDRLLRNAGMQIAEGATIERYLQRFADLGFRLDSKTLVSDFNATNYATASASPNASARQSAQAYRRLFDSVYATGYQELSKRVKAQRA
ncbi:MAG: DUF3488 and transglutaminase-like domain-containing protein [Candidatus Thiodiazotropha sp.]